MNFNVFMNSDTISPQLYCYLFHLQEPEAEALFSEEQIGNPRHFSGITLSDGSLPQNAVLRHPLFKV